MLSCQKPKTNKTKHSMYVKDVVVINLIIFICKEDYRQANST